MRFCAVGAANTAVDFTTFFLLTAVGVPYIAGQMAAYSAGVNNSFLLEPPLDVQCSRATNIREVHPFIHSTDSLMFSSGIFSSCIYRSYDLWRARSGTARES
jgi:putative flippase GtrA